MKQGDLLMEVVAESASKLNFAIKVLGEIEPIKLQKVVLGKVD